jgi:hypothetical protein
MGSKEERDHQIVGAEYEPLKVTLWIFSESAISSRKRV